MLIDADADESPARQLTELITRSGTGGQISNAAPQHSNPLRLGGHPLPKKATTGPREQRSKPDWLLGMSHGIRYTSTRILRRRDRHTL